MNIQQLIRHQYATVDAYASVNTARKLLFKHEGIVLLLDEVPIGVLTLSDLANRPHQLAFDCLRAKPQVESTDRLDVVVELMRTTNNYVLPVFESEKFYGLVVQTDLLMHLNTSFEQQKFSLLAAAHDLKIPFAAVSMLSDMLIADPAFSAHQELIQQLTKTCDYAQSLIQNILITEQSLSDSLVLKEEDLDTLVSECIVAFSKLMEEKHIVASTDFNGAGKIRADGPKLKRAINNILSNSIKYTRPGGKVSLSTASADGTMLLRIKDTGIGIPASIQKSIFDKFTRAKRPGTAGEQTTGLGLYLTKEIVEWHGGTISLESDGKTGTCFTISLPQTN